MTSDILLSSSMKNDLFFVIAGFLSAMPSGLLFQILWLLFPRVVHEIPLMLGDVLTLVLVLSARGTLLIIGPVH